MAKVSVIVPVFNCEKYLSKCLDSVLNQSFKDIEIICVNDGSTDGSYNILQNYEKNFSNIILINQDNKKQGAARNRGLEIATGEFITFLDSDDWIEPNYIENLYNAITKHNVNVAAASICRDKKNKKVWYLHLIKEAIYTDVNSALKAIDFHLETAGKLYRFEGINNLRFQENIFFEDAGYTIRAINSLKSLVTVPNTVYHYVSNEDSTIKNTSKNLTNDKILTSLDVINYAEENKIHLKDFPILKERHFFYTIKHYKYKKVFYLFGLKLYTLQKIFSAPLQNKNEDKKVSIIIPTLQKNKKVLDILIRNLQLDTAVSEIIIIDNSLKGLEVNNEKLKVIIPKENMYVNPSWNYGVDLAKSDYIALLNDDIIIPENFCSRILEQINITDGILGMDNNFIEISSDIDKIPKSESITLKKANYRCNGYGIAMFMPKEAYTKIPPEIKIMFGDDWLLYKCRKSGRTNYYISGQEVIHLGSLSTSNKSFINIFKNDSKHYRRHTVRLADRIFSIQEREDDYKLRILGLTFKLKKTK